MTRNGFVNIINNLNLKTGVELGVATGLFSEILSKSNLTELFLVDKWDDHHNLNEKSIVMDKFKNNNRIKIIHSTFLEASKTFSNDYFDFIYIDGYAHTGQDNGQTLEIWWSKIKKGGLFSGHDYHIKYQPTIDAVNAFCAKYNNLKLSITSEERFPSWFLFK